MTGQRDAGNYIVCGNHSQIEKDVFEILLKGDQPLILIQVRGMKARSEPEIEKAVAKERLLVLSPFDQNIKRVTKDTAEKRNRMMIGVCDCIIVGHIIKGGQLNKLLD